MTYEVPAIVKATERLLLDIEQAVRRFSRYHKYTTGTRLREQAMEVAQLAHRAWRDRVHQEEWTNRLAFAIDNMKISLQLGKQIEAFASFNQFELLSRGLSDVGRQCGGWRKQQRQKSQNATASKAPAQRAQILSSQTALCGANP